jgi:hypothetical protein
MCFLSVTDTWSTLGQQVRDWFQAESDSYASGSEPSSKDVPSGTPADGHIVAAWSVAWPAARPWPGLPLAEVVVGGCVSGPLPLLRGS